MRKTGELIDGRYKILRKLGEGGMSVVYLAVNEKVNKHWAIKEVKKEPCLSICIYDKNWEIYKYIDSIYTYFKCIIIAFNLYFFDYQ